MSTPIIENQINYLREQAELYHTRQIEREVQQ
jgi:hypothetical protein